MAVSRALRFQVFRRDGNTCQYCGGQPPDVALVIDHVVPVALGGADDPTNLLTSCRECNAGKSASPPDAPLVAAVSDRQQAYRAEMERLALEAQSEREAADLAWFVKSWNEFEWVSGWTMATVERGPAELPDNWQSSLRVWLARGLTRSDIEFAMGKAQVKDGMRADGVFRYMAGVCWRILTEREDAAAAALLDGDGG